MPDETDTAGPDEKPPAPTGIAGAVVTRRRLLIGLSALTAAGLAADGVVVGSAPTEPRKAAAQAAPTRPAVTRPRTPKIKAVHAPGVPVQPRPISTLAEYRRATGARPFP